MLSEIDFYTETGDCWFFIWTEYFRTQTTLHVNFLLNVFRLFRVPNVTTKYRPRSDRSDIFTVIFLFSTRPKCGRRRRDTCFRPSVVVKSPCQQRFQIGLYGEDVDVGYVHTITFHDFEIPPHEHLFIKIRIPLKTKYPRQQLSFGSLTGRHDDRLFASAGRVLGTVLILDEF